MDQSVSPKHHPGALACVNQTEMLERYVPLGIMAVFVGYPVLGSLVNFGIGTAIVTGLIGFVVGGFVVRIVRKLVLQPVRAMRYKSVAGTLAGSLQTAPTAVAQWLSWYLGSPGALAVTKRGDIVIVDRSTGYQELWLTPAQIAHVGVEREATHITNTKHGGRYTLGRVSGSGIFSAYTFGGRSQSITQTVETAFVEVRYQFERNGPTYMAVIPFGDNRRAADALCATLSRLEHQGSS